MPRWWKSVSSSSSARLPKQWVMHIPDCIYSIVRNTNRGAPYPSALPASDLLLLLPYSSFPATGRWTSGWTTKKSQCCPIVSPNILCDASVLAPDSMPSPPWLDVPWRAAFDLFCDGVNQISSPIFRHNETWLESIYSCLDLWRRKNRM